MKAFSINIDSCLKLFYLNSSNSFTHSLIVRGVTAAIVVTDIESIEGSMRSVCALFDFCLSFGLVVEGCTPAMKVPSINDRVSKFLMLNFKIKIVEFQNRFMLCFFAKNRYANCLA